MTSCTNVTGNDPDATDHPCAYAGEASVPIPPGVGASFSRVEGFSSIQSQFSWDLGLWQTGPGQRGLLRPVVLVVDSLNKCKLYQADTVEVEGKYCPR